jgi:hypothetical protein
LALTRKPVPGVLNTTPRGELTLKKLPGKRFGSASVLGTPSQLISRRSPPKEPFAPATVPPPTAARKASRVAVIAAGLLPADSNVMKEAQADGTVNNVARNVEAMRSFIEPPRLQTSEDFPAFFYFTLG